MKLDLARTLPSIHPATLAALLLATGFAGCVADTPEVKATELHGFLAEYQDGNRSLKLGLSYIAAILLPNGSHGPAYRLAVSTSDQSETFYDLDGTFRIIRKVLHCVNAEANQKCMSSADWRLAGAPAPFGVALPWTGAGQRQGWVAGTSYTWNISTETKSDMVRFHVQGPETRWNPLQGQFDFRAGMLAPVSLGGDSGMRLEAYERQGALPAIPLRDEPQTLALLPPLDHDGLFPDSDWKPNGAIANYETARQALLDHSERAKGLMANGSCFVRADTFGFNGPSAVTAPVVEDQKFRFTISGTNGGAEEFEVEVTRTGVVDEWHVDSPETTRGPDCSGADRSPAPGVTATSFFAAAHDLPIATARPLLYGWQQGPNAVVTQEPPENGWQRYDVVYAPQHLANADFFVPYHVALDANLGLLEFVTVGADDLNRLDSSADFALY